MTKEHEDLLKEASALRDEIEHIENHLKAGKQFKGNDMYDDLVTMTEAILSQKVYRFKEVMSQLKEMETNEEQEKNK